MASIQDVTTGTSMEVKSDQRAQVNLPTDAEAAGFIKLADGIGVPIISTENGALNVSEDSVVLVEQVDGAALNTNVWQTSASGMTVAQANGFITLNSTSATTANAYAILSSVKVVPLYAHLPLRALFNFKTPIQPQSNLTQEIGIGTVATNAAPTDGAFFRWNSSTQLVAVINNGGSETQAVITLAPSNNIVTLLEIQIVEDEVEFYINDELVADMPVPSGQAYPTNAGRLPVFVRVYNGASAPSQAPQINIGQVYVGQQAMKQNKTWGETLGILGRGFYQSPLTAFGQTANHANSTAPVGFALSNTAAGYATLGGKFAINSQAAAATDGIVFGFQNVSGYQLLINGISISTAVTGAAIVTATVLDWAVGINSSALSLATTDGAGTWAPRRVPLGVQGFLASAGIGTVAGDIVRTFSTPLVVDSGRYFHVIASIPNGANTGSLVYRGAVTVLGGYFE